MDSVNIPRSDEDFIVSKLVEGWDPELIHYSLKNDENSPLQLSTVKSFIELDSTQERVEMEKQLQEKKAEVSREDLIRELSDQIEAIKSQRERLTGEHDDISNDTTKNLLKAVRDLADMIDVLENKEDGASNVVNINRLEQNIQLNKMVKHLPAEDKQDVVEQLEDDPEVEDFMIMRKDEVEEVVTK